MATCVAHSNLTLPLAVLLKLRSCCCGQLRCRDGRSGLDERDGKESEPCACINDVEKGAHSDEKAQGKCQSLFSIVLRNKLLEIVKVPVSLRAIPRSWDKKA